MSYAFTMLARSPTVPPFVLLHPLMRSLSVLGRRAGLEHPKVAAAAHLDALPDWFPQFASLPRAGLHDRVREGLQVVFPGLDVVGVDRQPHHVPAARRGQPGGVLLAQVVTVRLDIRGQRPEYRGRFAVHVRQRVNGRMLARGARAATGTHRPTSLTSSNHGRGSVAAAPRALDTPM